MNEHDVICSAYKECEKLPENTVKILHDGDKDIKQRPEYCSGRHPHRYNAEEDSEFFCSFVGKYVKGKRLYKRVL